MMVQRESALQIDWNPGDSKPPQFILHFHVGAQMNLVSNLAFAQPDTEQDGWIDKIGVKSYVRGTNLDGENMSQS
jgi:hypothetical protein